MNPASHHHGHRRHSKRSHLNTVMLVLLAVFLVSCVFGLIWFLSNPKLSTLD